MRLLEVKGLPVSVLIDFVHRHGGILGPAHPCGEKYLSFTNTSRFYKSPELIKRFDFIEAFNACESAESNEGARKLAEKYKKPGIGGSDAHRPDCIGTGYTILPERVTCETELIALIRSKAAIEAGGVLYGKTAKDKMGPAHKILTYSFWFYNKGGALLKKHKRTLKGKIEIRLRSHTCIISRNRSEKLCTKIYNFLHALFYCAKIQYKTMRNQGGTGSLWE